MTESTSMLLKLALVLFLHQLCISLIRILQQEYFLMTLKLLSDYGEAGDVTDKS